MSRLIPRYMISCWRGHAYAYTRWNRLEANLEGYSLRGKLSYWNNIIIKNIPFRNQDEWLDWLLRGQQYVVQWCDQRHSVLSVIGQREQAELYYWLYRITYEHAYRRDNRKTKRMLVWDKNFWPYCTWILGDKGGRLGSELQLDLGCLQLTTRNMPPMEIGDCKSLCSLKKIVNEKLIAI